MAVAVLPPTAASVAGASPSGYEGNTGGSSTFPMRGESQIEDPAILFFSKTEKRQKKLRMLHIPARDFGFRIVADTVQDDRFCLRVQLEPPHLDEWPPPFEERFTLTHPDKKLRASFLTWPKTPSAQPSVRIRLSSHDVREAFRGPPNAPGPAAGRLRSIPCRLTLLRDGTVVSEPKVVQVYWDQDAAQAAADAATADAAEGGNDTTLGGVTAMPTEIPSVTTADTVTTTNTGQPQPQPGLWELTHAISQPPSDTTANTQLPLILGGERSPTNALVNLMLE